MWKSDTFKYITYIVYMCIYIPNTLLSIHANVTVFDLIYTCINPPFYLHRVCGLLCFFPPQPLPRRGNYNSSGWAGIRDSSMLALLVGQWATSKWTVTNKTARLNTFHLSNYYSCFLLHFISCIKFNHILTIFNVTCFFFIWKTKRVLTGKWSSWDASIVKLHLLCYATSSGPWC